MTTTDKPTLALPIHVLTLIGAGLSRHLQHATEDRMMAEALGVGQAEMNLEFAEAGTSFLLFAEALLEAGYANYDPAEAEKVRAVVAAFYGMTSPTTKAAIRAALDDDTATLDRIRAERAAAAKARSGDDIVPNLPYAPIAEV